MPVFVSWDEIPVEQGVGGVDIRSVAPGTHGLDRQGTVPATAPKMSLSMGAAVRHDVGDASDPTARSKAPARREVPS